MSSPSVLSREQQAIYDLCVDLHRDRRPAAVTRERVRDAIGEQALLDAIGICGYYALLAMVLNAEEAK